MDSFIVVLTEKSEVLEVDNAASPSSDISNVTAGELIFESCDSILGSELLVSILPVNMLDA